MPPLHNLDRRSFLLGPALFGLPTPRSQHRGDPPPAAAAGEPADDFAAFARLTGLEFAAAERQQATGELLRQRQHYRALRDRATPFELPPCASFDPWPPGAPRPLPTPRQAFAVPRGGAAPAADEDVAFAPVLELARWLRDGKVTSRRLVELSLARLQRLDPRLLCVVTLLRDEALRRADELDRELAAGRDRGVLHGIPYGAKDLLAWPSAPTTFGAAPFREHRWTSTATCLERLHDAGAVLVAKLSLGALAMGDLWFGGRTRNPWLPEQGSSGSSAGSASAVAAGLVPFAIGSETLGSIVSPCRQCGVGGLRPTFGAVSRHGAMPLSWTMDKIGVIARSAHCAAIVFDTMRGADGKDPAARDTAFVFGGDTEPTELRFGVVAEQRFPRRDDERQFLRWLDAQGITPRPVTLPDAPYGALLTMLHAEAAAAFDDFTRALLPDGRSALAELPGQDDGDWPNLFRAARAIPAVEYLRASRLRRRLCEQMHAALQDVDVLIAPTHGGPTLTASNLTGHPTYVLPVGRDERQNGRPTVLALVGRIDGEAALLSAAHAFQRSTSFHLARPPEPR